MKRVFMLATILVVLSGGILGYAIGSNTNGDVLYNMNEADWYIVEKQFENTNYELRNIWNGKDRYYLNFELKDDNKPISDEEFKQIANKLKSNVQISVSRANKERFNKLYEYEAY